MAHTHSYTAKVTWTGAAQGPTANYQSYSREYLVEVPGKPALRGSADATFRGDPALHNPEDLLVEIVFAIIWAASDRLDASGFVTATAVVTFAYLVSRGIAKASRVLEH